MSKIGWTLVETLEPDRITVVARDEQARSRTSFERAVQDRIGGGKGPGSEAAAWLSKLIDQIRSQPAPLNETYTLRNGQELAARLLPVVGPDQTLHGVQLWVGEQGSAPTSAPQPTFGFTWDSARRLAELPPALTAGLERTHLTAPEIFRVVETVDAFSMIQTLLISEPRSCCEGAVTMRLGDDPMPAHLVMVAGPTEDQAFLWRGLLFETAANPAPPTSLEAAALAAIPRMETQVHMALVDIAKFRLIRWITDAPKSVQWKGMVDNRDTPHPNDVQRIFDSAARTFAGETQSGFVEGIRLRRKGGGWVVVDGAGALVQATADSPALAIIQMRVTGYSDEPDPVPPTDEGHPGLD
ncbi:GAF domain-containing protein [Nocardia fluminea]|uniref:GAF domain-containing protein n=1 Tax=Nocardia fluminea TaxID=134984 RepID=UPI003D0E5562